MIRLPLLLPPLLLAGSQDMPKPAQDASKPAEICEGYPGLPCVTPVAQLGPGVIVLTQPTTLRYRTLEIADGTVIETNGNPLTLNIEDKLTIKGSAVIRAFGPGAAPPPLPAPAAPGASGISYDPGPGSEGAPESGRGAKGGDGTPGSDGAAGAAGRPAGPLAVHVGGRAFGALDIDNSGGPGGYGGTGGRGGAGGNGQQGGRGTPAWIGCAKGGGYGGDGGDGGPGGAGGVGGPGGEGGRIEVRVSTPGGDLRVSARAGRGASGVSGVSGASGSAGEPGYGGRGARGCQGEETNRRGKPGRSRVGRTPIETPGYPPSNASIEIHGVARTDL